MRLRRHREALRHRRDGRTRRSARNTETIGLPLSARPRCCSRSPSSYRDTSANKIPSPARPMRALSASRSADAGPAVNGIGCSAGGPPVAPVALVVLGPRAPVVRRGRSGGEGPGRPHARQPTLAPLGPPRPRAFADAGFLDWSVSDPPSHLREKNVQYRLNGVGRNERSDDKGPIDRKGRSMKACTGADLEAPTPPRVPAPTCWPRPTDQRSPVRPAVLPGQHPAPRHPQLPPARPVRARRDLSPRRRSR